MANVTPNLRLNLPTYDQPGWDTLMNANLQIIDSLVARVATLGGIYLGIYLGGASYGVNNVVTDQADSSLWQAQSSFTTAVGVTFAAERASNPSHWVNVTTATNNAAASAVQAAGSATTALNAQTTSSTSATNAAASATTAATSATTAAASAASTQNTFKNKLLNPQFNVQQINPGNGSVGGLATSVYVNDCWSVNSLGAVTLTGQFRTATDAERTAIGDEGITAALQTVSSGAPGVNDFAIVSQAIEGIRLLAGKTVVLSFWAAASANGSPLCIEFFQNFGSGGSPSSTVTGIGQQKFTLTTTPTLYTTTPITIPSSIGKTLGTTVGTDFTGCSFWMSAGATIGASRAASMGTGAYTLSLFNPQLEVGNVASAFERRPFSVDNAMCLRYYETDTYSFGGYNSAGGGSTFNLGFKVTKRIVPAFTLPTPTLVNCSLSNGVNANHANVTAVATALGAFTATGTWIADARL